jgi:mono/diheme cytochrome c family protein
MKTIKLSVALLIMLAAFSCKKSSTAVLYTPTAADATSKATLDELQQGRTLYISNCGSCHDLYSPDDYSATQWTGIMSSMAPKTRMTSDQTTLVTKYVTRGN